MKWELHSVADYNLVDDWTDRWLALIELINSVTGSEEPPFSPPLPAEIDEVTYQSLRFWFMDHEAQFLPLWKEFCENRDWHPSEPKDNDEEDLPQKYLGNPFLFFYEPENLYHLAQQMDLQSGIDIWEPSEHRARMVRPVFVRLGELLLECLDWVDKREDSRPYKTNGR
ncbi:MAG: hypothetical protein A2Z75_06605 [Chloroflexi bacterium RBG_13_50_10]|nr:MAG: hypothetical protein A2Z75_06605 [Chloroflexi bacterium RBG_13_50_10]